MKLLLVHNMCGRCLWQCVWSKVTIRGSTLQWRHNERDCVPNPRGIDCLLNHLFGHRSKKTYKLCVTGLCEGNSPVTGEFPAQRPVARKLFSIWWRHHDWYAYIRYLDHCWVWKWDATYAIWVKLHRVTLIRNCPRMVCILYIKFPRSISLVMFRPYHFWKRLCV